MIRDTHIAVAVALLSMWAGCEREQFGAPLRTRSDSALYSSTMCDSVAIQQETLLRRIRRAEVAIARMGELEVEKPARHVPAMRASDPVHNKQHDKK